MRKTNLVMLIGLMLIWSPQVNAVDFPTGWYAGGSAGVSNNLDFCAQTGNATFCDKEEFAWKIVGGYQFLKWVGLEAGYVYLGEPETTSGGGNTAGLNSSESDGFAISVPFTVPILEKIGLYGKVGGFLWDRESIFTDISTGASTKASADGFDPMWGFGFRWPLGDRIGVSLDYEQYTDVGDALVGISDIEFFSAGILWQF